MDYESKHLDHLGIVAAACREIGIAEEIDKAIPPDPRQRLTTGECFLAMIINGLGFTSRPLSLTPQYFRNKPIDLLIKPGITAEEINDDVLGRAMDTVFNYGCTTLFSRIAYRAIKKFKVSTKYQHLDSTVMRVHGEYTNQSEIDPWAGDEGQKLITFGRPKDGNQSLQQYLISMIVTNDGGIPMLAETVAGNKSDQTQFRETLKKLKEEIKDNTEETYHVADAALYSEKNLEELENSGIKFITHVPAKIKETARLNLSIKKEQMTSYDKGYSVFEVCSIYGEVKQRWLIVHSEQAFKKEYLTLKRNIKKEQEKLSKAFYKLKAQSFSCEKDAVKAARKITKDSKFQDLKAYEIQSKTVKEGKGRPKAGEESNKEYKIAATAKLSLSKIRNAKNLKGRFVLATNELDTAKLSAKDLLSYYKDQQQVERGFRFLKNPLCMTEATFFKKTERIVVLGMLMCLCLLVYSIAQRQLRLALKEAEETIPNQINQKKQNPTLRWIFQIFEGVDVLYRKFNNQTEIMILNLDDLRRKILALLGFQYQKIYLSAN